MPVMDEFKEEREALKQGTFKQKLQYFMDYYKWYVIGGIAVAFCAGSLIYHYVSYKEVTFSVALLNSTELQSSKEYASAFMEYAGLNPSDQNISFDTSLAITFDADSPEARQELYYTSREKFNLMVTVGELDAVISNDELFSHFANSGIFCDLRPYLSPEQLEAYEPYFYYVDAPLVAQISAAELRMDNTFHPEIPDPTKPELMEQPVPVGIYVENNEKLTQSFFIRGEGHVVIGMVSNAPHPDTAAKYAEYLMSAILSE
ncbi:MAG: hypothetical protein NC251_11055 [Lachnoclostridium sp.]|nr:hypothetical protein [Lachnospira sp.]MCM1248958.1 hypothetical protein [Lachnoclostridium sp.]